MRRIRPPGEIIVCLFLGVSVLYPQADNRSAFEVASVKLAQPLEPRQLLSMRMAGTTPNSVDGGYLNLRYANLENLIVFAWGVKPYQVAGPSWIRSERYDIRAKLPSGSDAGRIPGMLRALLKERFNLIVHTETTEKPVYLLLVGKEGLKLKASPPPNAGPPGGTADREASPVTGLFGNMKTTIGPGGAIHLEGTHMPVSSLVGLISRFVDRPVVDGSGLHDRYDISLDLSLADLRSIVSGAAIAGALPPPAEPGSGTTGTSIFETMRRMGLKLVPQNSPMEVIVVDKADKKPSEN